MKMNNIEKKILSLCKRGKIFRFFTRLKFSLIPFNKISELLPDEGQIYELGSGYGFEAAYLALDKPGRVVTGIDIDKKRVETAKNITEKVSNLRFSCADIKEVDLSESNGILMVSFLHHLQYPDQVALIKKCYDSLTANGTLLILDPVNHPPFKNFMNWLSDWLLYPFSDKAFLRSKDDLVDLVESAGFDARGEIEKSSGWGLFSYALVVGKKL